MMSECNECTVCCFLTHIPQLEKPIYKQCRYCEEGARCIRYKNRPKACKNFTCVYRAENLIEELRPDKCHIMFERLPDCTTYVGLVLPMYSQNWLSDVIQEFATQKLIEGYAIVVTAGQDRFIKCPEGIQAEDVMKELRSAYINHVTE